MRVLRYVGPGAVAIEDAPLPTIDEGEVLIEIESCGICATDVKTFLKGHARIEVGRVLGHEVVGVVAESGDARWRTGTRVVVAPYVPCLDCGWCARGEYTLCVNLFRDKMDPGGFAEYARLTRPIVERGLFEIPAGLDPEVAALGEPLGCSLHGLRKLGAKPGESLLVIGDGTMGLLQAGLARGLGLGPVIVAGATPARLAFAEKLADHVIDATSSDVADQARTLTGGVGPDNVMVSVPIEETLAAGVEAVRRGGTINVFAGFPKGSLPAIDINRIHYQEITLVGSFGFTPEDFRDGLALALEADLPLAEIITDRVPLEGAEEAMRRAGSWAGMKTLVKPQLREGADL